MGNVPIICPTHNRAGLVTAFKAFGNHMTLCVAESQVPAYEAAYPDADLLVHPDSIVGSSPKRGWLYEKFGTLFMVDDDVGQMIDFRDNPIRRVEPDEARDVIERCADTAAQLGAKLWGVHGTGNPMLYKPGKPFKVSPGLILGCAMGLHPSDKLWFPQEPWAHEDLFISGLNAYHHRFVFQDLRYGLEPAYKNQGGRATVMTSDWFARSKEHLADSFGEAFSWPDGQWVPKLKVPW